MKAGMEGPRIIKSFSHHLEVGVIFLLFFLIEKNDFLKTEDSKRIIHEP